MMDPDAPDLPSPAHDAARRAIAAHLERTGKKATVEAAMQNLHRVRYRLPDELPKVSLVALADDEALLGSYGALVSGTDYANLEAVAVTAEGTRADGFGFKRLSAKPDAGEADRFNLAAKKTTGELLCFIDANLKPLASGIPEL